jgi:peroxiredoxin
MKKILFLILAATFLSLRIYSAETDTTTNPATADLANPASRAVEADLKDLVGRINAKLQQDKSRESDLADNLKEFDTLLTKHKDAPATARAEILMAKAQLYMQVLQDPEKALDLLRKIKKDYPAVQINGNMDQIITALDADVQRKKIRDTLAPGSPFPDFSEKDLNGKLLSISQYKGKVVLVDFWATWCMPCVVELPQIQKAYDMYHDKGFEVVGVSLDEDKDRLQQFIKQKQMPWPQFFDGKKWENKLAVKYGVDSTPTGYLLGRDGKIIAKLSSTDDISLEVAKAVSK